MNKEITAFDSKHRYFSLYEKSINISSRLESEDRFRSIDLWSKMFITTSSKTKN